MCSLYLCMTRKGLLLREKPMTYQLVGEVMAHQGYDGYRV